MWPRLPLARDVRRRAVASADRLGVRCIDLYQVHTARRLVSDRTLMRGMRALREAGRIGEVGVSNYGLKRWQGAEALLGRRVLSNQVQYSIVNRGPEDDLLPYAEKADRLVIAYSPLARGFVSGRYDAKHLPFGPVRREDPLFQPENLERAAGLLATPREMADVHQATPSQIALAYVLRHPSVVAIPGASSVEQMEHDAAAADIDLTEDEHAALVSAARAFRPVGTP
jgi:aryl-alcohol dehydrogenase-like predicted oxidoreductase